LSFGRIVVEKSIVNACYALSKDMKELASATIDLLERIRTCQFGQKDIESKRLDVQ